MEKETIEEAQKRIIAENKAKKAAKIYALERHPVKDAAYMALIEEIQAVKTEKEFIIRDEGILWHHEVGRQVVEFGRDIPIDRFAEDSHISPNVIKDCKVFYEKYPDLSKARFGKNVSWRHIRNKLLYGKKTSEYNYRRDKPASVVWVKCPFCKANFNARNAEKEIMKEGK